jgi:hypothetical protein
MPKTLPSVSFLSLPADQAAINAGLAVRSGCDEVVVHRTLPLGDLPVEEIPIERTGALGLVGVDLKVNDTWHGGFSSVLNSGSYISRNIRIDPIFKLFGWSPGFSRLKPGLQLSSSPGR